MRPELEHQVAGREVGERGRARRPAQVVLLAAVARLAVAGGRARAASGPCSAGRRARRPCSCSRSRAWRAPSGSRSPCGWGRTPTARRRPDRSRSPRRGRGSGRRRPPRAPSPTCWSRRRRRDSPRPSRPPSAARAPAGSPVPGARRTLWRPMWRPTGAIARPPSLRGAGSASNDGPLRTITPAGAELRHVGLGGHDPHRRVADPDLAHPVRLVAPAVVPRRPPVLNTSGIASVPSSVGAEGQRAAVAQRVAPGTAGRRAAPRPPRAARPAARPWPVPVTAARYRS